jgi:hypothetical protein
MTQSMSRVGRCMITDRWNLFGGRSNARSIICTPTLHDNGPMESFWGTLKCEKYYLHTYSSYEELEKDIQAYIDFYNNDRLQAKLNGLSPMEYRTKAYYFHCPLDGEQFITRPTAPWFGLTFSMAQSTVRYQLAKLQISQFINQLDGQVDTCHT